MLWETAVLNKLHKTNKFRDIRLKEVPQKQPDAHSSLEVIKQEEAKNSKNDCDLFAKYGLEDLTVHLTSISFYSELLRYYDSIKDLVEVDIEQYIHWTGYLFRHCHEKGTKHTEYDHAIEGLKKLNKHLAIRTCMIGHSLSILDVVTISIIRTNQDIWKGMQEKSFEGFENIYRLSLWIEGAMDIKWDIIYGREMKKKNHKSKSHAPKEITGSKEIVQAVKRNNIDKAREILKANPLLVHAVNMKNNKGSLIHIAWEKQNMEMIKLLVEHNWDLEALDWDHMTPLYWAIEQKNTEIVTYLIDQGVNLEHKDSQNRSSIYWAASCGEIPNLKLLLDAGCDPNVQSKLGRTALSKACWNGFIDVTRVLLETGKIDIDVKDNHGRTALHNAVWGSAGGRLGKKCGISETDSPECAQLLLENGADPNFKDNTGNSPLNIACSTFGINCMRLLISFGAEINLKNNYGTSPFLSACYRGNYECCKVLYEYEELDPYVKTRHGYGPLELAIEAGKDRVLQWVIDEKVNNNTEYKGLELESYDQEKLLHHAVNNPENACKTLLQLANYVWSNNSDTVISCFEDILNRAMLRKSKESVKTLLMFYQEKELHQHFKFSEVILECWIHLKDLDIFKDVVKFYNGGIPQIALQSAIFSENDTFTDIILKEFSSLFQEPELYQDLATLPRGFIKIIENDLLKDYVYFDQISHPIFSIKTKLAHFLKYNPLQLAVYLDNSRIMKLIFDRTCYKASTPLANGDNILHLVVSHAEGDPYILQKLLLRLEFENGSKEAVRTQFLEQKNQADGLSVIEFCAGMKIYAPIVFKYTSVDGWPEDDMYAAARVLDIEIVHDQTVEEEAKADKKAVAEEVRLAAKQQKKHLIKSTEMIAKKYQYVVDYSVQWGLDLSDISYIEKIPTIKDKPYKFIDTLEDLKECAEDLATHNVLGVDLEFSGDKRIFIASLLQISTLEIDYVIDVLVLRHSAGPILSPVFSNPKIVKIFHGCDYDILLLLTDLEIDILNVFDTGRALKSMMKTSSKSDPSLVSFDYLVSAFLGFKANKFFQRAEWRLRPLPKVMLNYARADSHYLHFIYAILMDLMADATKPVALLETTAEEHKAMLEERTTNPSKWKGVMREFQKKMSKFMVQRIEKSGKRTYQVIVHNQD